MRGGTENWRFSAFKSLLITSSALSIGTEINDLAWPWSVFTFTQLFSKPKERCSRRALTRATTLSFNVFFLQKAIYIRRNANGAMQMAQHKWRVRRLGLGLGLGFVIALRCAICIAPNTESPTEPERISAQTLYCHRVPAEDLRR